MPHLTSIEELALKEGLEKAACRVARRANFESSNIFWNGGGGTSRRLWRAPRRTAHTLKGFNPKKRTPP